MSLHDEAYGPAEKETFTLPPAFPQTVSEYANDILASPLGVNRPSKGGTLHTATWIHPITNEILELWKLAANENTPDLKHTYTLDVRDVLTGEPLERYLYREYPGHKVLGPEIGHSTPAAGECGTITDNLRNFTELLRTAHIQQVPVVFRHGEANEKVNDEFWHMAGHDFFSAPSIRQEVAQLALTGDEDLREELLDKMCGPSHTLPEDFAKHLLNRVVKLLQAE